MKCILNSELPQVFSGSQMLPCTTSRTSPRAFWPLTPRVQTQMLNFSQMETSSGQSRCLTRLSMNNYLNLKLCCNPLDQILCEGITYSNWPWGTQMCNLSFGSWSYDSSDFILHFYDDMVSKLWTALGWINNNTRRWKWIWGSLVNITNSEFSSKMPSKKSQRKSDEFKL